MSMSDEQRILWAAAEKFYNLLMLLNLYFSKLLVPYLFEQKDHNKIQINDFKFISNVFIV